jgi:hypothetical protein
MSHLGEDGRGLLLRKLNLADGLLAFGQVFYAMITCPFILLALLGDDVSMDRSQSHNFASVWDSFRSSDLTGFIVVCVHRNACADKGASRSRLCGNLSGLLRNGHLPIHQRGQEPIPQFHQCLGQTCPRMTTTNNRRLAQWHSWPHSWTAICTFINIDSNQEQANSRERFTKSIYQKLYLEFSSTVNNVVNI